jgi:type IV secretion system protein VirB10
MSESEPSAGPRDASIRARDPAAPASVLGERAAAIVHRVRSIEARASSLLAALMMGGLGIALLTWYYSAALHRPARAAETARALAATRAQGDAPIPALPELDAPRYLLSAPASAQKASIVAEVPTPDPSAASLTVTTTAPASVLPPVLTESASPPQAPSSPDHTAPRARSIDRRLTGPAFVREMNQSTGAAALPTTLSWDAAQPRPPEPAVPLSPTPGMQESALSATRAEGDLTNLLRPVPTPVSVAQVLPTQRLLLAKGAFIDCTLETAINSSLPGMTTCITATDTFGADGKVVLLERGTKLVGETRGQVQQGGSRVFVLWSEARTPTGVVIPLDSPATDELGRSGVTGTVERHFWERFGAAMLISIIDVGAASQLHSGGGTLIYSPSASQDVVSEVLKDTMRIAPTVAKNQGDRLQVLVARDLDFRSVYELRAPLH